MDIKKAVGLRIKNLRIKRKWSQEELALRAEISVSHIGRLERGEKGSTIGSLEKVINALDITFVDLFRFIDKSNTGADTQTINDIVDKLSELSFDDQEFILNLIDILPNRIKK